MATTVSRYFSLREAAPIYPHKTIRRLTPRNRKWGAQRPAPAPPSLELPAAPSFEEATLAAAAQPQGVSSLLRTARRSNAEVRARTPSCCRVALRRVCAARRGTTGARSTRLGSQLPRLPTTSTCWRLPPSRSARRCWARCCCAGATPRRTVRRGRRGTLLVARLASPSSPCAAQVACPSPDRATPSPCCAPCACASAQPAARCGRERSCGVASFCGRRSQPRRSPSPGQAAQCCDTACALSRRPPPGPQRLHQLLTRRRQACRRRCRLLGCCSSACLEAPPQPCRPMSWCGPRRPPAPAAHTSAAARSASPLPSSARRSRAAWAPPCPRPSCTRSSPQRHWKNKRCGRASLSRGSRTAELPRSRSSDHASRRWRPRSCEARTTSGRRRPKDPSEKMNEQTRDRLQIVEAPLTQRALATGAADEGPPCCEWKPMSVVRPMARPMSVPVVARSTSTAT